MDNFMHNLKYYALFLVSEAIGN